MPEAHRKGAWLRLGAEFVVIVVGVLVALGVDSLASWTQERALEREYLERLLQDVEYDLAELSFVEAVAEAGRPYADSLLLPGPRSRWTEAHLVGAVSLAANSRQVDLSRSTFQELVNSGRIGLIRSREVRTELANYDRLFREVVGFWDHAPPEFQIWVRSRLPNRVIRDFREACGMRSGPAISDPTRICPFEIGDWSAAGLRLELGTDEARRLLNLQTWRIDGTLLIVGVFRTAAERLRSTLADELRAVGGTP